MSGGSDIASKVLPSLLADVGHGSHLCAFYETKEDLIDLVLPFFAAGSSRGDACVWIAPDSLYAPETPESERAALIERGIELHRARDVYIKGSRFQIEPMASYWEQRIREAHDAGRSGVHASGDAYWLRSDDWKAFLDYEMVVARTLAERPVALLCTYPLSLCKTGDIFDVACAHQLALAKRKGAWEVIKGWGTACSPPALQQKQVEALEAAHRVGALSRRERQVLDGLTEGRPSKVVADDLGISIRTVEAHRAHLLRRLEVRTIAEAVRLGTMASLFAPA
jgi:DNA-binding CsgD family transcriptional regulator